MNPDLPDPTQPTPDEQALADYERDEAALDSSWIETSAANFDAQFAAEAARDDEELEQ